MPGIRLRHVTTIESVHSLPTPCLVFGKIPDCPPKGPDEIISGTEVLVRECAAQQILWMESEQNHVAVNSALSAIRETFTLKL